MEKTIKFNLICDEKPIRTIEDLQNNFSLEDVLEYYQNGLLLRWLEVRGYEAEYRKVAEINETDVFKIVKELIKIFDVETDEKKIEEGIYIIQFQEERKELYEAYEQNDFKTQEIIDDYQVGFKQLLDGIIENPNDVAIIKANIAELMSKYKWVMDMNHRQWFWDLKEISPLAIMCLLMNDEARKYYLPIPDNKDGSTEERYDIENNADKRNMYNAICSMIEEKDVLSELGDSLYTFAGETDGYWKDLETKGKKYMILSMGYGDFVRSAGVQGGDLSSTDIENKFVIIDGIDYKSNSEFRQLLYMEV